MLASSIRIVCSHILLVDTQHFSQALVPEIDIVRVHLVQDEIVTVVSILPQLFLQFSIVECLILTNGLIFLHLWPLLFSILDAPIARLSLSAKHCCGTLAFCLWCILSLINVPLLAHVLLLVYVTLVCQVALGDSVLPLVSLLMLVVRVLCNVTF